MYTTYLQAKKSIYRIMLLSLGTMVLGGCSQSHQLGVESSPQELLNAKLADPSRDLSTTQSISLIEHCARLGERNAASVNNKEVVMVLGNTGVGKSTFLNYLLGCDMKAVKPSELGLTGLKRVVIVDPRSARAEVMSIGHENSQTFMPQVATEPNHAHRVYCDCPGFSDNRGAEINIANSLNINRILQNATGVKAVFLTGYNGLFDDRGSSLQIMEDMCLQMFGGIDNLRRHKNAVRVGITKAPLFDDDEPVTRSMIRELLTKSNRPVAQILANRVFLCDPLDRGGEDSDFWSRDRCRTEIAALESIPKNEATTLFQAVLTGNDQTKLKLIMRNRVEALVQALEQDDYPAAGDHWQSLARLRIIKNDEVETMLNELALTRIQHYVSGCMGTFRTCAAEYQFDQAEQQLSLLRMLTRHFSGAELPIDLAALESLLTQCKKKKEEEERNTDEKLKAAKRQAVQKVQQEMEEKLAQIKQQLEQEKQRNEGERVPQLGDNFSISITLTL
jgi:energy-coupling factor transporter ATP-binding protein EcfA2